MLNVIMLNVNMLNVIMLNVIMLNLIMLIVVILSVVVPLKTVACDKHRLVLLELQRQRERGLD